MWNVLFLFQGLLFVSLLFVVFKSKKRIMSEENRLFHILTIENISVFIVEILLQLSIRKFGGQDTLSLFLGRLYLVGLYLWFCIFSIYTYYISVAKNILNEEEQEKKYSTAKMILYSFIGIGTILMLVVPMYMMHEGETIYSYGPSVDLLKIAIMLSMIFWIVLLINDRKALMQKKYAPIFVIIILLTINVILQTINPSVLIASFTLGFTLFIMFFTIENPDLQMIQELQVAREQADKANNAKTDFLSNMSHEIRTPLNAIVGFSDCIMEAKDLGEAKENAKDIINAGQTLLEIVNGILDISKIEAGKLEIINSKYNAHETFMELAKLISTRMKDKGLDFTYYIAPDVPETLYGDHANLKKIVTNLLSNACKYTDQGFVRYEVNCVNMKDYTRLIISVEDSGRGIKKESVDKMFTKFQRLDEDKNTTIEGTGLGLAITKQLTELMGGKIIVHTIYGEGSKFTVVVNQRIAEKDAKEEKQLKDTLDLTDVKILIVDDAPMNLKVAKKILEKYNANCVDTCESGFECINKLNIGREYDLILLDDMMPKMSGVITLQKLKEDPNFHIPTIALTANAITGMREKYLQDGFDDFLAKPIDKNELVRVINDVLGRTNTERLNIVEENQEEEKPNNEIIPVENDIEKQLGSKLDLSKDKLMVKKSTEIVEKDTIEVLEDEPQLIPTVDDNNLMPVVDININLPNEKKYDEAYLKENGADLEKALELLGDMEMYNSTISDFTKEIDEKWKNIKMYRDSHDMENYAILVHSLKSDCKYLGFYSLADIAYEHELKSKAKDLDYVLNHFNELESEYNRVIEVIKNYSSQLKG